MKATERHTKTKWLTYFLGHPVIVAVTADVTLNVF